MTTISPARPFSPAIPPQPGSISVGYKGEGSTSTTTPLTLAGKVIKQTPAKKPGPLDQFINAQPTKPGDPTLRFPKTGGWESVPGTKPVDPKKKSTGQPVPTRETTPSGSLKNVTGNIFNPDSSKKLNNEFKKQDDQLQRVQAEAARLRQKKMQPNAVNPNYKLTEQLPGGRTVSVGARNDGSMFIRIPDQFDLNKTVTMDLKGITTKTPRQHLRAVIEKLCSDVDTVPYVFNTNGGVLYNDGGAGSAKWVRPGKGWILAHAGDRKAKAPGFPEHGWENGDPAIASAIAKGTIPEVDVRCNVDKEGKCVLVRAHDQSVERLDGKGKVNVETDSLEDVKNVAGTLKDMLKKFPSANNGRPTFALEMKKGVASAEVMAKALYTELKAAGRLKDVLITSMHSEMLTAMYDLAKKDRVSLKLMKVLGFHEILDRAYIDNLKESTPYIRYVSFPINASGLTNKDTTDYAKRQGLFVGAWNWDPTDNVRLAKWSNRVINNMDLDINITDDIDDAKKTRPATEPGADHWR